MKTTLTIDPGITIGYALWDSSRRTTLCPPLSSGTIAALPSAGVWLERTDIVCSQFISKLELMEDRGHLPSKAICEWPSYMSGMTGQVSADSGALVKLVFMVGRIAQICAAHGCEFEGVDVNRWKGQLSKTATKHRIQKRLGLKFVAGHTDHALDAIGIGLWWKGFFE